MLFYKRYAGTCQVSAQKTLATSPPDPRTDAIKAAFVETLNDHTPELRECYTDSLRYGETHGTVRLGVVLHTDGRAEPVTLLSDTVSFAPLACCIVAVVRALRFESFSEPAAVSFEYPFSFHTLRTTTSQSLGIPYTSSGATRDGFLTELDESTVAIGGLLVYPLAPDGVHYYTDVEESEVDSNDAGAATPR